MTPMMFPYLMYQCWLVMFFPQKPKPEIKEIPARYEG